MGQPFKIRVCTEPDWQRIFPRPQADGAHTLLLEVEEDGMINMAPMFDLFNNAQAVLLLEAQGILEEWLCIVEAWQTDQKASIIDILACEMSSELGVLDAPQWGSFWRQLVVPMVFRIKKNVKGQLTESSEHANMHIANPVHDIDGGWTLREVEAVCRRHVADSLASCNGFRNISSALDKISGARGNQLQNGFACLPDE